MNIRWRISACGSAPGRGSSEQGRAEFDNGVGNRLPCGCVCKRDAQYLQGDQQASAYPVETRATAGTSTATVATTIAAQAERAMHGDTAATGKARLDDKKQQPPELDRSM